MSAPIPIPIPFPSTELGELSHTKRPRAEDDDGDRDRERSRRRLSMPNLLQYPFPPITSPPTPFEPSSLPRVSPLAQHLRARNHLRANHSTPPRPRRVNGMDVDDKAMLYPSDSLEALFVPLSDDTAPMTLPYVPSPDAGDQMTALANVRWLASLDWPAASQIPRNDFIVAIAALAAALQPVDQQVLATYLLKGHAIESLSIEELYLLSREIANMWAANGDFTF